jgi:hypothetical protein
MISFITMQASVKACYADVEISCPTNVTVEEILSDIVGTGIASNEFGTTPFQ